MVTLGNDDTKDTCTFFVTEFNIYRLPPYRSYFLQLSLNNTVRIIKNEETEIVSVNSIIAQLD